MLARWIGVWSSFELLRQAIRCVDRSRWSSDTAPGYGPRAHDTNSRINSSTESPRWNSSTTRRANISGVMSPRSKSWTDSDWIQRSRISDRSDTSGRKRRISSKPAKSISTPPRSKSRTSNSVSLITVLPRKKKTSAGQAGAGRVVPSIGRQIEAGRHFGWQS